MLSQSNTRPAVVLTLFTVIAVMMLIGACRRDGDPTAVPTVEPAVGPAGANGDVVTCIDSRPAHMRGYVDGELIMTGAADTLDRRYAELGRQVRGRTVIADLSQLSVPADDLVAVWERQQYREYGIAADAFSSLRVELWRFDCDVSIDSLLGESRESGLFAEPNLLTSGSAVNAQTFGVLNDPTDSIAPIDPDTAPDPADVHDAVATQASSYAKRFATSTPAIDYNDAEVGGPFVAVFDNAPDPIELVPGSTPVPYVLSVDWAWPQSPPLVATVVPYPVTYVATPGTNKERMDHGLFTAGIIHSLAPSAQITIFEVLNKEGEGTLAHLEMALFDLLESVAPAAFTDPTPEPVADAMAAWVLHLGLHTSPNAIGTQPYSVATLLDLAGQMGATMIAASGNFPNNSSGTASATAAPPASLAGSVTNLNSVGAAARATSGAPDMSKDACFARSPTTTNGIREFGGYAMAPFSITDTAPCKSLYVHHWCSKDIATRVAIGESPSFTCEEALIGLSYGNRPTSSNAGSGHAYWIGTSFSAAAITGWVASVK